MIGINNIIKRYSKGNNIFTALDSISLNIKKGDFCIVLGPSGAGKSTLLFIIGGLIHPDSGTLLYNGNDIYKQSRKDLDLFRRRHLGFMFQQFHLMPYLTVLENIKLACYEKKQIDNIGYFLKEFSMNDIQNKYPSELSMGEKQRTAFIRSIISNPVLLLADEPTGNLDQGNSEIILSHLKDYHKNKGTVILVTHNPEFSYYANMIIKLEKGRITSEFS